MAGEWQSGPSSEDSHGRALWSLGHIVRYTAEPDLREEARQVMLRGLPATAQFTSPRAWAFTLLGLASLRTSGRCDAKTAGIQCHLAQKLMQLHEEVATAEWCWFEDCLSYDNARLPQALLLTAEHVGDPRMLHMGMESLDWLMQLQRSPENHFRAIGSDSVFQRHQAFPTQWDQQPLEAYASMASCLDAHRIEGSRKWLDLAWSAFSWFEGANDLGLPVGNYRTGTCFDGLRPIGVNLNCGAESTLAFLHSCAMVRLRQMAVNASSRRPAPSGLSNVNRILETALIASNQ
jgi:hypothetical protein